jgi:two-component system, OmpR family, phosphate regulon sensor histidine kinase PhoR
MSLFLGTVILASFISYLTLKDIVIYNNTKQLEKSINLLASELQKRHDLDAFAQEIKQLSDFRFTLIDQNGTVIAESDYDRKEMENHASREEVIMARTQPYGTIVRYSHTLKTDFLYVAKKITYNNQSAFLRLSMSLKDVFESFGIFYKRIAFAVSFFILLAIIIPYQLSKKIHYDIKQITNYLEELSNKNYQAIIQTRYFSEFLQISIMLKNLAKKLTNRAKQKRKHAAKLRLINIQRNDMLSAMSHEFKNPIAAINGYAETLRDDPDSPIEIRTKFLEKIISNAMKISAMLDRLSLSVKLENNDLKIEPSSFDLAELCRDVSDNLNSKYHEQRVLFKGKNLHVRADKTMIELVLINLIDNALKYSQQDVMLELSKERLSIQDRGIGINKEDLKKITSKFYRVRGNSWDNSMGLGLAIVEYILKLHQLELRIHSIENEGSTFSFDLKPIVDN